MRATLENICYWHFFEKKTKKTFQKVEQFYFSFDNTFVSQISSMEYVTSDMKNVLSGKQVIQMLTFALQKIIRKTRNYN